MKYLHSLLIRLILALVIPFSLFYVIFYKPTILIPYWILIAFGYNAILGSKTILINNTMFSFVSACVAASAYYLLTLLILTTKDIGLRKSIKLWIYGSLIILGVNIIRIVLLIVVYLESGVKWFETLHLFIWKFVASVFVVLLWIWLTNKFKIKTIPVYSDLMELSNLSKKKKVRTLKKRKKTKRK